MYKNIRDPKEEAHFASINQIERYAKENDLLPLAFFDPDGKIIGDPSSETYMKDFFFIAETEMGLNGVGIAEAMEYKPSFISQIRSGEKYPPLKGVKNLSKNTGIRAVFLVDSELKEIEPYIQTEGLKVYDNFNSLMKTLRELNSCSEEEIDKETFRDSIRYLERDLEKNIETIKSYFKAARNRFEVLYEEIKFVS